MSVEFSSSTDKRIPKRELESTNESHDSFTFEGEESSPLRPGNGFMTPAYLFIPLWGKQQNA